MSLDESYCLVFSVRIIPALKARPSEGAKAPVSVVSQEPGDCFGLMLAPKATIVGSATITCFSTKHKPSFS